MDGKICYGFNRNGVLLVISNLEYGGAQRQIIELANGLHQSGETVHLCMLSAYAPLRGSLILPRDNVHFIEKKAKFDFSVVFQLFKLIKKLKVAVVHGVLFDAEISARIAGRLSNVGLVVGSERNSDYKLKVQQRIAYAITRGMRDLCIANSEAGARFNSRLLGYDKSHYVVVRNCVDTSWFSIGEEPELRSELVLEKNALIVGVFASIKPQKDHATLFRAIAQLAESDIPVHALLVGDVLHEGAHGTSEYAERLSMLVDTLGIRGRLSFLGNRDDVEKVYRVCDVTVLPSIFEGTPNVILESMACGIPVIATDVSDNKQIIDDGNTGFLFDVGDYDGLAKILIQFAKSPDRAAEMRLRAREEAERSYTRDRMVEQTAVAYTTSLATRAS